MFQTFYVYVIVYVELVAHIIWWNRNRLSDGLNDALSLLCARRFFGVQQKIGALNNLKLIGFAICDLHAASISTKFSFSNRLILF